MTRKIKKLALSAVALSMLTVASVPILTQNSFENAYTEEEERAMAEEASLVYADPNLTRLSCGFLSGDNSTICEADEDGFYTTESGVRFLVFGNDFAKNHASYLQYGGSPYPESPARPA